MESDLISRQAAIRWVKTECNPYGKPTLEFESGKKVIEHLEQMPSAQPEPAQWVQMLINPRMYKCSNCQVAWNKRLVFDNEGHSENIFMKYCPCCGRKMKAKIDYE